MTIVSVIERAKLQRPPRIAAPCGHRHGLDGSVFVGSTAGVLTYLGSFRCRGAFTHVYTRKD